ncbi:D-alanyl-D-alanine carboxypeptidase family protein [Agrobacterium tumefaciens]|uniref:D-alanyl-D-alanine carboxypeptidase family protein n=1 Tax=Agrobacterium tumefaciens TaxID=358 RepID=UPI002243AE97|nr:D-alanyl-D-alanine carboxypeptidase family protein [Agrobacterium tumefaciens]MCW8060104.1 D-alanyl-D-alanine carboxypeptidase [Agrobacterium tumefaciens]
MAKIARLAGIRAFSAALGLSSVILHPGPSFATPTLVVDVQTLQVLQAEEEGHLWYPASTTKLMTAFVVMESLRAGRVSMDTPVLLSPNALRQKFLNSGLRAGSAMSLEDALFALIAGSANDVAVALAETVAGSEGAFVKMMNDAAKDLGMNASHFANPNGLFDKRQHSSARDLAILGIALTKRFPEYRHFFKVSRVLIDGKPVESHNQLLTAFQGTVGMKTGFLCAAGQNIVAVAEREGRKVLVVVLGATTERERNERAAQFLSQAFAGTLDPKGLALPAIANDSRSRPEDMRLKLCSDQTAAYEQKREALYPFGLPGHTSFLNDIVTPETHSIRTWKVAPAGNVGVPSRRPRTK